MKIAFAIALACAACLPAALMGGDDQRIVRFYAGEVLRAELKPDDGTVKIVNVNKFAPRSRVTVDVGYAVVTVRPDKGRSLGIYDYSLVNRRRTAFPCVAITNEFGEYDASLRELQETKPNKLYNFLFRVEMPRPNEKPEYTLRFNLVKGKNRDPRLLFVDVTGHPYTKISKIPLEGMLGVVPDWPKPKPVEKPEPPKKKDGKTAAPAKKGAGTSKTKPKPVGKKTQPKKKKTVAKKAKSPKAKK
ncbi:MAG: hypothetical protein GXP32_07720 [Kiritimatiellaeota bacterium]|nr:hypothetical protein [Kiritimatiellota bacterium]